VRKDTELHLLVFARRNTARMHGSCQSKRGRDRVGKGMQGFPLPALTRICLLPLLSPMELWPYCGPQSFPGTWPPMLLSAMSWMSVSPKFKCGSLNHIIKVLGEGGFGRRLSHGYTKLVTGISALMKESKGAHSPLLPSEDTARRCHVWARKWALIRHQICWHSPPPELWGWWILL
jgi:hypothetical protein